MCHQQGHNKKYCKVLSGEEAPSQSSQDPDESSRQAAPKRPRQTAPKRPRQTAPTRSSQPAPSTPRQTAPTSSIQPAPLTSVPVSPTSSSQPTHSTAVCDDTTRVRRVNQSKRVRSSSQPAPPTDISIPIARGITSQLPLRRRQVAGQKRAKVATGEKPASRGHKRAADVGFGIYTSTSGAQILNLGTSSQRILETGSAYKDASPTGIDLGYKAK
ncbi:uncharacterized protein LOC132621483 [Lycium barbarum]|uniref:uncharacterized protein LOC132621483 n=1 Tax=Lycium barbarum TaxID=112863 RepID=UPI00293E0360|nr:uncharacterized protein LOC132621483 [Lycium barbarum]